MIDKSTFDFLVDFKKNNRREWYLANKDWYNDFQQNFIVSKNVHEKELQTGKYFDTAYDLYYQMADFIFYLRKAIKQS